MEIINTLQIRDWLRGHEIVSPREDVFIFENGYLGGITLPVPQSMPRVIALANILLSLNKGVYEGSLFWLSDWGMWGPDSDSLGMFIWRKICQSEYGEGILHDSSEAIAQASLLLIPMIFQWDAYLVLKGGAYIVFSSHDGYVCVLTRSSEETERLMLAMKDWNPQKSLPCRFNQAS